MAQDEADTPQETPAPEKPPQEKAGEKRTHTHMLDMALDELVEKSGSAGGKWNSGGGSWGRGGWGERGWGAKRSQWGEGGDGWREGRKRPRVPADEKALLNTQCFFNDEGDFVVRLYDTDVFAFKKRPEVADGEGKASEGASPGVVLVLTTGGYRTIETKLILSEALEPLSLRIADEGDASKWTVVGEGIDQPFEDGMEVILKSLSVRASAVKEHLEDKMQRAKSKEQERHDEAKRPAVRHNHEGNDWQRGRDLPPGSWGGGAPAQADHWHQGHSFVGPPPPPPPPGWGVPLHPHAGPCGLADSPPGRWLLPPGHWPLPPPTWADWHAGLAPWHGRPPVEWRPHHLEAAALGGVESARYGWRRHDEAMYQMEAAPKPPEPLPESAFQ